MWRWRLLMVAALLALPARSEPRGQYLLGDVIQCGNLIYAGNKTSRCFSARFLQRLSLETNIETDGKFTPVRLAGKELYHYPFCVMTGEGGFKLTEPERVNLRNYLTRGGFLLASAGCSDQSWAAAFRREIKSVFPKEELKTLPASHPVFRTVYEITSVQTAHGRKTTLEGLHLNGRLVVVFSQDGLNDTEHAKDCCCCGGDEVLNCEFINVNAVAYALLH